MTADRDAADGREHDPLLAVVADPERGRDRLPYLLDSLGTDDRQRRLRASLALCLAVDSSPDLLEPVVRGLLDRLDGDSPAEIPHALEYLAARYPDAVASDLPDEAYQRLRRYRSDSRETHRNHRTESPSGGDRVGAASGGDEPYSGRNGDEETDTGTPSSRNHDTDGRDPTRGDLSVVEDRLSAVIDGSRFEEMRIRSTGHRGRFGRRYRAVGAIDGEELPLSVIVFGIPEGDGKAFARALGDALEAWAGVADRDTMLAVRDWGLRPRPWAAVEHADATVADRDALEPAEAVANAIDVADALAHAHQHGVVHGALDPLTVAYPDAVLAESERRRPQVTAFGLARVYAEFQGLGAFVDPRYAAPEHYDGRFGRVDNVTDVYALGALLYRLVTGETPFVGRPDEVETGVCSDRTPVPSEVDPDLPAALDRVVRKAMATRKLTRYETVTHVRRALEGIDADGG
ncbi:protein kinase domain-containing protein [Halosimplex sp. J119]